jgi:hypothetical protein
MTGLGARMAAFEPKPYFMHSLRSFFSMLLPWPRAALVCSLVLSACVLAWALRGWRSGGPLALKFSLLLFATVLVDPHLHAYELVVLVPALLLTSDWLARADRATAGPLGPVMYLSFLLPLVGPLALVTRVQFSVVAFGAAAFLLGRALVSSQQPSIVAANAR